MITLENAEKVAQELLETADQIGKIMKNVDGMARANYAAIKSEPTAYEIIILGGSDLQHAMRTLAMRLDRAALGKLK